jgi:hypothetical protein
MRLLLLLLLLRVSSSVLPFVAPDLGKHRAGGGHDQQDAPVP